MIMKKINTGLLIVGRGIGQVMLQENALSGWLMWAGICIHSWQMALLALAGTIVSTLTAYLCGYSREAIKQGLYGFNGTLVGIATAVFLQLSAVAILLMVAASSLSTWIARLFQRQQLLPGFTSPFILAVWLLLGFCSNLWPTGLLPAAANVPVATDLHYVESVFTAIGQVMFQENSWSGLLFLVAILCHSRVAALYTLLGACLPLLVSGLMEVDTALLNRGLMGYNGVLCAIALGGTSYRSMGWASGSALLSVGLQLLGMHMSITTLTAPFVLAVWMTQLVMRLLPQSSRS